MLNFVTNFWSLQMAGSFDGRKFLFNYEYETYMRRMPVRYLKHLKNSVCSVCDMPAEPDNPLENSHLIPFSVGIRIYRLTPDYLDGKHNIVTAHRRSCNKSVELNHQAILAKLAED